MNGEINNFFKYAQLAQASYGDFNGYDERSVTQALVQTGSGFSIQQAQLFLRDDISYSVISQQPNTSEGFSAAVFKSSDGEYVLAVRGTETSRSTVISDAFRADMADIGGDGIAVSQAIDLFNYYQRLTAVAGEPLVQYQYHEGIEVIGTPGYSVSDGLITYSVGTAAETGVLAGKEFTVTGHSLGGHLANIMGRLAGASATAVYTYNAPGFDTGLVPGNNNTEWFFSSLKNAQEEATGRVSNIANAFDERKITNLVVPGDVVSEIGTAPGKTLVHFAEKTDPGGAHSIVGMTDSLALQKLFAAIDSTLDFESLKAILKAQSSDADSSLEAALDSLRDFFAASQSGDIKENTSRTKAGDRDEFYKNLFALEEAISGIDTSNLKVRAISESSASQIVDLAKSDIAYRYALHQLDTFVLSGNSALYSRLEDNEQLAVYDPSTGTGKLTTEWLTARADLLNRQIQAALLDREPAQDPFTRFGTDDADELMVAYSSEERGGALFGSAGDDVLSGLSGRDYLEGGDGRDRLEGRAGADTLRGMAGDDIIHGGEGNDYLEGGLGADTYRFVSGDGFDRIVDVHGNNHILIEGLPLSSAKQLAPGSSTYHSDDERVRIVLSDADNGKRSLSIEYGLSGRILIEDYRPEAFGLKLEAYQEPEAAAEPELNPVLGDLKPVDADDSAEGEQLDYDQWGNVRVTDKLDADHEDRLFDTDGNDELLGFGGNDTLDGTHGGNDRLDGGAGDDVLYDDKGDDTLIGGTGSDRLRAGEGNDRLFAERPQSLSEALQAEPEKGLSTRGDWLDGSWDDDLLIGSDAVDMLLGGDGKDTLYGGAGDDHLYGDGSTGWVNQDWSAVLGVEQQEDWTLYITEVTGATIGSNSTDGDDDVLFGGAGNDHLIGNGGNDLIDGGRDNDVAFGDAGNDTLRGGAGNDVLSGDSLDTEGPDSDLIAALHGRDVLDGGEGNDRLTGNSGDDVLFGGAGDDVLSGDDSSLKGRFGNAYQFHGNDYLQGGSGNDSLWGGGGNDTLLGGEHNDWLVGDYADLPAEYQGADLLDGGSGDDTLFGAGGNDTLIGGEGSDRLSGDAENIDPTAHGDDLLFGGNGHDSLWGQGGADTLQGGDGNDFLRGDSSDLPDWAQGADSLEGGLGSDTLLGDGGNDTLRGGEGVDYLSGGSGNNLLDGGAGSDVLEAGSGDDRYVFNPGYGYDSIRDAGGRNVVEFGAGFTLDALTTNVVKAREGDWLTLYTNQDGLRIHDYQKWADSTFRFADGRELSFAQVMKRVRSSVDASGSVEADVLYGTDNGDTLRGGLGDDRLSGQGGADILAGGAGNDTYVFELGDGDDMLADDQGDNVVRFGEGIERSSLSFAERYTLSGTPVLEVTHSGGSVAILKGLTGAVSRFEFADGSVLSLAEAMRGFSGLDLQADDNGARFYGSDAADVLAGGNGSDVIDGQGGDDEIRGGAGDDSLLGGAGNDALQGGAGDDHLLGGAGDDTLVGGSGNDTLEGGAGQNLFIFREGSQSDLLIAEEGSTNILQLDPTRDIGKLTSQRLGDDLILAYRDTDDAVQLKNYFANPAQWNVQKGDGPVQDMQGFLQNLALEKATLDLAHYEQLFRRKVLKKHALGEDGRSTEFQTYKGSDYVDHYTYIKTARFEEGSLLGGHSDVSLKTTIETSQRSEIKEAHVPSSSGLSIAGSVGSGSLAPGVPQVLRFGPDFSGFSTNGLMVIITGGYDKNSPELFLRSAEDLGPLRILIYPLDSSGSATSGISGWAGASRSMTYTWRTETRTTLHQIVKGADEGGAWRVEGGNIFYGGQGDDSVQGYDNYQQRGWEVMLSGGDGNDTLRGTEDDDFLIGGSGIDLLYGRKGEDTYIVTDEAGEDIIADFVPVKRAGTYDYQTGRWGPYTVEFDEKGREEQDRVILPEGVTLDRLEMSWGQLLLEGHYLDRVIAERVLPGYSGDSARARMAYTTLDISWGSGQVARVVMPRANEPQGTGIELFRFADGSTLTLAELLAHGDLGSMPDPYLQGVNLESDGEASEYGRDLYDATPLAGGIGNDTLTGSGKLEGWDGDDLLTGRDDTNDVLNGGRGADTLIGGGGNDYLGMVLDDYYSDGNTYIGGKGNDTLFGSEGADTYRFARGDGQDVIIDLHRIELGRHWYPSLDIRYGGPKWSGMPDELIQELRSNSRALLEISPTYTGRDTLELGEGIAPEDVTFRFDGMDLLLEFGNDDGIRFDNWRLHEEKPLKQVVFADGTVWGEEWIEQLYPYATAGNDLLYLDERDDTVAGGLGRDEIHGGLGSDTYLFALGDGEDLIVETASPTDRNVLRFTDGILPDDIQISRDGRNLQLSHRNGTDRVTLKDWFSEDEKRPLARVEFADGSVWTGEDWYRAALSVSGTKERDYLDGLEGSDTLSGLGGDDVLDGYGGDDWLAGGPGDDRLYGSAGNDELHGASGEDRLYGGDGNDTLVGGAGADTLEGDDGDDLYHADALDKLVEYADGGTDTVMTSDSWTLGENFEDLVLVGNRAVQGIGNALDNRLRGNDAANRLTGGAGADFLWGRGGDDVLDGGAGNDTLVGDRGNDGYLFGRGYGRDTIVENDNTVGNLDSVRLLDGVSADQLWFRRLDEHLDVQVAGTTDSLQIKDWYKGDAHRVERFTTADGKTLLDSQVQSLVDAMASFGVPAGGESNLTPNQRAQLEVVIAANWQ